MNMEDVVPIFGNNKNNNNEIFAESVLGRNYHFRPNFKRDTILTKQHINYEKQLKGYI